MLDECDFVYLTFLRTFAALNGETGTPLKQIVFLPGLRRLGVTVLLSLPTGRIGKANRKGARGSPFAVANPFILDNSFIDPLLPNVDAITQYRAMVHACTLAGIRCGSIVPAATIAVDSELIRMFPTITYWWRIPPGTALRALVADSRAAGSPDAVSEMDPDLITHFSDAPDRDTVVSVIHNRSRYWRSSDALTPATACPDVVGDEAETYSWADVAAIRFGSAWVPDFGPTPDATLQNRGVQIMGLAIAWRAAILGERVFWIDVAQRVPDAVLRAAATLFENWDGDSEDLCRMMAANDGYETIESLLDTVAKACTSRAPKRRIGFIAEELYGFERASELHDAVVGPWVFCVGPFSRDPQTLRKSMRHHIGLLSKRASSVPFLAGLGDHDAIPPAVERVAALLVVTFLLPGGVPFIFSGLEYGSQVIVNREFGFNTTSALRALRARLDDSALALFNDCLFPWHELSPLPGFVESVHTLLKLRAIAWEHRLTVLTPLALSDSDVDLVGYHRTSGGSDELMVCLNTNPTDCRSIDVLPSQRVIFSAGGYEVGPTPGKLTLRSFAAVVLANPDLTDVAMCTKG